MTFKMQDRGLAENRSTTAHLAGSAAGNAGMNLGVGMQYDVRFYECMSCSLMATDSYRRVCDAAGCDPGLCLLACM